MNWAVIGAGGRQSGLDLNDHAILVAVGVAQQRAAQLAAGIAATMGDDLQQRRLMHQDDRLTLGRRFAVGQPISHRDGWLAEGQGCHSLAMSGRRFHAH